MNIRLSVRLIGKLVLLLVLALSGIGCFQNDAELPVQNFEKTIKDYRLGVSVYTEKTAIAEALVQDIESAWDDYFDRWYSWSTHRGLLAQTNQAFSEGYAMVLDSEQLGYLERLKHLSLSSDSRFNPAIGLVHRAWRFDAQKQTLPQTKLLNDLVATFPLMSDVLIDSDSVRSKNATVLLELHSSRQGRLLEIAAMRALEKYQANKILVSVDNSLTFLSWKSHDTHAVSLPDELGILMLCQGESLLEFNALTDAFTKNGNQYHRVINSNTGRPANLIFDKMVVIHSDPVWAEGGAYAALVAGEDWQKVLETMNILYAFASNQKGELVPTPSLSQRLSSATNCDEGVWSHD